MPTPQQTGQMLGDGQFDQTFDKLYGKRAGLQQSRYRTAIEKFIEQFGDRDAISLYSTPGRTEVGGNHTDHNHGIVMAAAVNLDILAIVAKNDESVIRIHSDGFGDIEPVALSNLTPDAAEHGKSSALIRGVAAGIRQRDGQIGGFDAYITSDVLVGSGLSSSAAFEVCVGAILNGEYNQEKLSPVQIGAIGQYAENKFFGKPSGLMDQTACAVGDAITIDFKDPANPIVDKVPFDLDSYGYALVITDTKGDHANLTEHYAAIPSEMKQVAAQFGKEVLRDVDSAALMGRIAEIRKITGDRAVLRALHFFAECHRAQELAGALKEKNIQKFLSIILESGHSSFEYNQNAYVGTDPRNQDVPLALALSQTVLAGQGAWRLQGGGFAGTIQAFVPNALLDSYRSVLGNVLGDDACHVLSVRPVGCTKVTP